MNLLKIVEHTEVEIELENSYILTRLNECFGLAVVAPYPFSGLIEILPMGYSSDLITLIANTNKMIFSVCVNEIVEWYHIPVSDLHLFNAMVDKIDYTWVCLHDKIAPDYKGEVFTSWTGLKTKCIID